MILIIFSSSVTSKDSNKALIAILENIPDRGLSVKTKIQSQRCYKILNLYKLSKSTSIEIEYNEKINGVDPCAKL